MNERSIEVLVQACGCVTVPPQAVVFGIVPGAMLSVQSDAERRSLTFTLIAPPAPASPAPLSPSSQVACPIG